MTTDVETERQTLTIFKPGSITQKKPCTEAKLLKSKNARLTKSKTAAGAKWFSDVFFFAAVLAGPSD